MGSNVLKYMRDTMWDALYPGPLAPVGHKVQLKTTKGHTYHTRQSPCKSKSVVTLNESTWFRLLG
jgi:hypothetical protein